ncbi:MAG: acetolactate synthase large subunit [bacterium]
MPNSAEILVQCLENEGVELIFGIPGEENIAVMDALLNSRIQFVTVRHEQGAAFMADVHGRLTGKPGVCLATLGPGATNLVTGFADANMDRAPIVAIAGQGSTHRMHKESHQILDLVQLFSPISKYAAEILEPETVTEVVRKAFKVAQAEKPGGAFISLPENIASTAVSEHTTPLLPQHAAQPMAAKGKVSQAAELIAQARHPIILAGNGVVRGGAHKELVKFAEHFDIPVAQTFMAKGCIPFSHPLSLATVGLQARDYVACGFDRADAIICVGFDMVEYHPRLWHPTADKKIVHIDPHYAEVDAHYQVAVGVIGGIASSLKQLIAATDPQTRERPESLRQSIINELDMYEEDTGFPLKPQRILSDTRKALAPEDILISDVGAHKMWIARLFRCEHPNTCIISNGFASMGIGVPGAIAAKMANPDKRVMTITGDAGFMMNSQEIETALRHNLALVIMIWTDSEYGLIKWHQLRRYGRESNIRFNNPDFVRYAESFGAVGYRVESAEELLPTLEKALADDTVVVVDVAVDYRENMKLTEKLGELVCPV